MTVFKKIVFCGEVNKITQTATDATKEKVESVLGMLPALGGGTSP